MSKGRERIPTSVAGSGGDKVRFATDALYPTVASAVARLRAGGNVPEALCGWKRARKGDVVAVSDLLPEVYQSLVRQGAFGAPPASGADAPDVQAPPEAEAAEAPPEAAEAAEEDES